MSDRDVDAQFADIIAHWDEVAPLPDRGPDAPQTNEPPADLAGLDDLDDDPDDPDDELDDELVDVDNGLGDDLDVDGLGDHLDLDGRHGSSPGPDRAVPPARPLGVNPSPLRDSPAPMGDSIPVWRGATSGAVPDRGPSGTGARDGSEASDDEDEHFHPGPTAPLPPQEDLHFWGIVVGLVAGPLLLLWLVIFRPDVSNWWVLASLGLTVMGFVLLVLRQPKSRDEDDHDDGARV